MRTLSVLAFPSPFWGFAHACVTRGLDPRVHLLRKKMDRRVKPGDDDRTAWGEA
jgi:hypothetical protein